MMNISSLRDKARRAGGIDQAKEKIWRRTRPLMRCWCDFVDKMSTPSANHIIYED